MYFTFNKSTIKEYICRQLNILFQNEDKNTVQNVTIRTGRNW